MNAPLMSARSTLGGLEPGARSSARFWDRRAKSYAKRPIADEAAYERTLERVRAYLTPNDRVLELGCGTGTTALKLAASAREILATDYSTEMIAIAASKAASAGVDNVQFRVGTLGDPVLAPEAFDVVMAMNFLHLLDDTPGTLRSIRELVRPGGLFISKTPCVGDLGRLLRVAISLMQAVGFAPFVNFVSERELSAELLRAGFSIEETGMYPLKNRAFFVVARKRA